MRVSCVYGEHYMMDHDVTMLVIHTVNACTGGPFTCAVHWDFPIYVAVLVYVKCDGADLYSVT